MRALISQSLRKKLIDRFSLEASALVGTTTNVTPSLWEAYSAISSACAEGQRSFQSIFSPETWGRLSITLLIVLVTQKGARVFLLVKE